MIAGTSPNKRLALISMPWPLFNRPSVQLGTLKAYLRQEKAPLQAETLHPYLQVARQIGPELYHYISQKFWLSEALYTALLFPEQWDAAEKLTAGIISKAPTALRKKFSFDRLVSELSLHLNQWFESVDWLRYRAVGFSVSSNQLMASLVAASRLKKDHPELPIIFGGSGCAGKMGQSLMALSPLDYLVMGEGEIPLLQLCRHLAGIEAELPESVLTRSGCTGDQPVSRPGCQLADLGRLPPPDYRDYFAELGKVFAGQMFIPVLPLEFSRGCWWRKCSFCNLNLQWSGFRQKKAAQVEAEVAELSRQHQCLEFTFTDNSLPPAESAAFFALMAQRDTDHHFFGEIRSTGYSAGLDSYLNTCRRGGLTTIQVGIEALSDSLLTRMRKGTTVMDNIAAMRAAAENGIRLEGNLITEFPLSTAAEVEETLQILELVFPYSPLANATFFLGTDSPIDREPFRYGIKTITQHPSGSKLFPASLGAQPVLPIKGYRADRQYQRRLWRPVVHKLREWKKLHKRRNKSNIEKPLLAYKEGSTFLIIDQELADGTILHHRLGGVSRRIYLYCRSIRQITEIKKEFPTVAGNKIDTFLRELAGKRLLFSNNGRCLALAVRAGNNRQCG